MIGFYFGHFPRLWNPVTGTMVRLSRDEHSGLSVFSNFRASIDALSHTRF